MRVRSTLHAALLLACATSSGDVQAAPGPLPAPRTLTGGEVPLMSVAYSPLLNGGRAELRGYPFDSTLVAAVRRSEDACAALWAARGPTLLQAAREVTGAPYPFREVRAALSTCWLGSTSFPLIVNVASARQTQTDSVTAATLFVGTLFHEVLHTYVNHVRGELSVSATPLLTKYREEPARVRNHLHLLALQQVAYARLGLGAEFRLVETAIRAGGESGVLARAHDIVSAEGAAAFVRELEGAARRHAPGRSEGGFGAATLVR